MRAVGDARDTFDPVVARRGDWPEDRPVDQQSLRTAKLGLVLRRLRDHGPRSRARLAQELGLSRSAVSDLVAELQDRALVRSAGVQRGGLGRPGTTVEVDGSTVCGIGAE